MRKAIIERNTSETKIKLTLKLDGKGIADINTGCGFLDHMLTLFTRHALFDLSIKCEGDTYIDFHHSAEDIGIVLGSAFCEALDDKRGIKRYADIILPMDEALIMCAVDISGRDYLGFNVDFPSQKVGEFDTELVKEFILGFVRNANITLHIKELSGENTHHIAEAIFKALGRVLSCACEINERAADIVPSTKGVL